MSTSVSANTELLSQYGGKPCLECMLSGQYRFRTMSQHGIAAHDTRRIARQSSIRIEQSIVLSEVCKSLTNVCFAYEAVMGEQE